MKKTFLAIFLLVITGFAFGHETSEEKNALHWIADNPVETAVYAIILLVGIGMILLLVLPRFIRAKETRVKK